MFVYFRLGCLQFGSGRNRPVDGEFYGYMNPSTFATFLAAVGQPKWAEVSESKTDFAECREVLTITREERSFANQMIVAVFVLFLNLFIVVTANSYATIENGASKVVLLNRIVLLCKDSWICAY